jgi:hypothetical protein
MSNREQKNKRSIEALKCNIHAGCLASVEAVVEGVDANSLSARLRRPLRPVGPLSHSESKHLHKEVIARRGSATSACSPIVSFNRAQTQTLRTCPLTRILARRWLAKILGRQATSSQETTSTPAGREEERRSRCSSTDKDQISSL